MRFGGETFEGLHSFHAFRVKLNEIVREFPVAQFTGTQAAGIIMRYPSQRHGDCQAVDGQLGLDSTLENAVGAQSQNHVHPLQQNAVHEESRVLDVAGEPVENGAGPVTIEETKAQIAAGGRKSGREGRERFRPASGARW